MPQFQGKHSPSQSCTAISQINKLLFNSRYDYGMNECNLRPLKLQWYHFNIFHKNSYCNKNRVTLFMADLQCSDFLYVAP